MHLIPRLLCRAQIFEYFGTFTRSLLTFFELTLANFAVPTRIMAPGHQANHQQIYPANHQIFYWIVIICYYTWFTIYIDILYIILYIYIHYIYIYIMVYIVYYIYYNNYYRYSHHRRRLALLLLLPLIIIIIIIIMIIIINNSGNGNGSSNCNNRNVTTAPVSPGWEGQRMATWQGTAGWIHPVLIPWMEPLVLGDD